MELTRIGVVWSLTTLLYLSGCGNSLLANDGNALGNLPANFPSEADTLAYVDTLKHSNFSQWRSLEEVAKATGSGSCLGAVNTSVLTALYLLGLFNLCAASPSSCCIPELVREGRKKRRAQGEQPLLNSLTRNLSNLSLGDLRELPRVSAPNGDRVPIHISVVEQVRQLWDSNPRLLSNIPCQTAADAVRSSFISLSGVASGIILAYSIAQLNQCYPDHTQGDEKNKIWFFPIPPRHNDDQNPDKQFSVRSLPLEMPVQGEDAVGDGCERDSARMRDSSCVKLMSSNPCPYLQWVLLNRDTGKGECVPRLCPPGKVFVEGDQLCHPVGEEGFCPPNQRLYLTAWGEAVCDCQDGAFPGPDGHCHPLYQRDYCYPGTVLQFDHPSRQLACKADPCRGPNRRQRVGAMEKPQPYAQYGHDQTCYQLGSVGPCEDTERFGFDIDSLEPACVGLEEAGLVRPPKSYQYSHMSFPTLQQDLISPHFEVSYVILNGKTWELEMKTVTRLKRSLGENVPHSLGHPPRREAVVTFLDTRDFPTQMADVLDKFRALEFSPVVKDIMKYVRRTSHAYNSSKFSSRNAKIAKSAANDIKRSESIVVDEKQDNDFNLAKSTSARGKVDKSTSDDIQVTISTIDDVKEANSTIDSDEATIATFDGVKVANSGIDSVKIATSTIDSFKVPNSTIDTTKVPNSTIDSSKVPISTIDTTKVPNSTIDDAKVPNSTIDRTKIPNSTIDEPKVPNSTNGCRKVSKLTTEGIKVANPIKKSLKSNKSIPKVATSTPGYKVAKENPESPKVAKISDIIEEFAPFHKKKSKQEPMNGRRRTRYNRRKRKKNKELLRNGKEQRKAKRRKNGETKETPLPEGKEEKHKKQKEFIKTGNRNKGEDNKAKRNDQRNRNVDYFVFDEDFCSSVSIYPPTDQGRTSGPRSKEPQEYSVGIPRVERLPLPRTRSPDVGVKEGASPNPPKGGVGSVRTELYPNRRGQRKESWGPNGAGSSSRNRPASAKGNKRKRKKPPKRTNPSGATSVKGPSEAESLPDYLRNRGRRQAGGGKRRTKSSPGIINAPLLNQCRPGARRDYNGHCRLRVIPGGRGTPPPRKRGKSLSLQPTPPRMKCKRNERLDTRGICRTTLSGLG